MKQSKRCKSIIQINSGEEAAAHPQASQFLWSFPRSMPLSCLPYLSFQSSGDDHDSFSSSGQYWPKLFLQANDPMLLLPLVFLLLVALVFFFLVKFSIRLLPFSFVSFHKELKNCLAEMSLDCKFLIKLVWSSSSPTFCIFHSQCHNGYSESSITWRGDNDHMTEPTAKLRVVMNWRMNTFSGTAFSPFDFRFDQDASLALTFTLLRRQFLPFFCSFLTQSNKYLIDNNGKILCVTVSDENITTGVTSQPVQAITPFHFFDYINFYH